MKAVNTSQPYGAILKIAAITFFVIGVILRIVVSLYSLQALHPDEIYQYIEQAHRINYGYGKIPWEYQVGLRSFFIPFVLAGFTRFSSLFIHTSPEVFLTSIYLFSSVLSLNIPISLYYITKEILNQECGFIVLMISSIWYELLMYAPRPTPEVWSAYLLLITLALIVNQRKKSLLYVLSGFITTLAILMRINYVFFGLSLLIYLFFTRRDRIFHTLMGVVMMLTLFGLLDFFTTGRFLGSIYINLIINLKEGVASGSFGRSEVIYYFKKLIGASLGLYAFAGLFFLSRMTKRKALLLILFFSIVIPQSLIGHKEYRFIFLAIPILLIFVSDLIWALSRSGVLWYIPLGCVLVFNGFALFGKTPLYQSAYYEHTMFYQDPQLSSVRLLSEESDCFSILNRAIPDARIGGYSILRKNIPFVDAYSHPHVHDENLSQFSHIIDFAESPLRSDFQVLYTVGNFSVLKNLNYENKLETAKSTQIMISPIQESVLLKYRVDTPFYRKYYSELFEEY